MCARIVGICVETTTIHTNEAVMLAVSVLSPSSPPCDGIVHIYLAQCLDKSRQWHGPSFWLLAIAIWGAAATPFRMVVSFDELNQDTCLARGPKELISKITLRNDAMTSL